MRASASTAPPVVGGELHDLDDVETGRAADEVADFTLLQVGHHLGEDGGKLRRLAPTEVTAVQRALPVRYRHGQLGEVRAGVQLIENGLRFFFGRADLLR